MSNRLTYKKIFVDSSYRLPSSRPSADFSIELNENLETPRKYEVIHHRCFYSSSVENNRSKFL